MKHRKFNSIPTDAPETRTTMAHYVGVYTGRGADGVNEDRNKKRSRHYKFTIGRSEKVYWYRDKYLDDKAMELLEVCKASNRRLIIVGYHSPAKNGPQHYVTLTKISIYIKTGDTYKMFNPETGEEGYYCLKGLTEMEETPLFMGTETY